MSSFVIFWISDLPVYGKEDSNILCNYFLCLKWYTFNEIYEIVASGFFSLLHIFYNIIFSKTGSNITITAVKDIEENIWSPR